MFFDFGSARHTPKAPFQNFLRDNIHGNPQFVAACWAWFKRRDDQQPEHLPRVNIERVA
jgi:hypothetical protein